MLVVKTLDEFPSALQPQPIPPIHSPEFKLYFEAIINSSKSIMEAMERIGYGGPSSVRYHMNRLGIKSPVHWYGHPSPRSLEFAPCFENVVRTSRSARDAAARLGYAGPCMIYHHAKKLGIETPAEWVLKPGVRRQRQGLVPEVIMPSLVDRAWSGALVQGEGGIIAHYSKKQDVTALEIRTGMTDSDPIFKLCDCFGVARPEKPRLRPNGWKPIWECSRRATSLSRSARDATSSSWREAQGSKTGFGLLRPGWLPPWAVWRVRYLAGRRIPLTEAGTVRQRRLLSEVS